MAIQSTLICNGRTQDIIITHEEKSDETLQRDMTMEAMTALNSMRKKAAAEGFKTDAEIEALIAEARGF